MEKIQKQVYFFHSANLPRGKSYFNFYVVNMDLFKIDRLVMMLRKTVSLKKIL